MYLFLFVGWLLAVLGDYGLLFDSFDCFCFVLLLVVVYLCCLRQCVVCCVFQFSINFHVVFASLLSIGRPESSKPARLPKCFRIIDFDKEVE